MKFRGHVYKRDIAFMILLTGLFFCGGVQSYNQMHISLQTALSAPFVVSAIIWILYGLSVL